MKKIIIGIIGIILVLLAGKTLLQSPETTTNTVSIQDITDDSNSSTAILAQAFLATLTDDQLSEVLFDYSLEDAQNWSNLPQGGRVERVGIPTGDLSTEQMTAFAALMAEATGTSVNEGWDEIQQIMNSDDYLAEIEGGPYGADKYYLAFLGAPSDSNKWQLQFGGHHLAVSNTYENGILVGSTPSFTAVEPFAEFEINETTNQPLTQEVNAFANVIANLNEEEAATALLAEEFKDILTGPGEDESFSDDSEGLLVSTLTSNQQALVIAAMETYVNDTNDAKAAEYMETYISEFDATYIAYSGTPSMIVKNDYFRIDGPSVWIEYSMQGGVVLADNHPHSIWRDKKSDYGA